MAFTAEQKRAQRAAKKAERDAAMTSSRAKGEATAAEKVNQAALARPDLSGSANVARPSSAGAKVVVGCKLGVAYFDIQLCRMEDKFQQNMQGGRIVKEAVRVGKVVRLRGTAYPRGTVPAGFPERPKIVDGAALNYGVDKDFWDQWAEQNRLNPLLVNGMIFAQPDEASAAAQAAELKELRSGLEPINPDDRTDPRIPKSTRTDLSNVETEESRAKRQAMLASATS